jgi:hypothetical protein
MVLLILSTLTSGPLVIQRQLKALHCLGSSAPSYSSEGRLDFFMQVNIAQGFVLVIGFMNISILILTGIARIFTSMEERNLVSIVQFDIYLMFIGVPGCMVLSLLQLAIGHT